MSKQLKKTNSYLLPTVLCEKQSGFSSLSSALKEEPQTQLFTEGKRPTGGRKVEETWLEGSIGGIHLDSTVVAGPQLALFTGALGRWEETISPS